MSLSNLANRLSALGRWEEALAAGEEAAALRCQLSAARPGDFTPDLAMSRTTWPATSALSAAG